MRSTKKTIAEEVSVTQEINLPIIIGWRDCNQVAETVWSCMHDSLLRGNLMIAYKDGNMQIIVSKYPDGYYGVSYITQGYTSMIPYISSNYIMSEIIPELEKCKLDKLIIETLKNNL